AELHSEQSGLFNQKNILFHQQKNKVSSLQKDLEYREVQLESIEARVDQHQVEIEKVNTLLKNLLERTDLSDIDLKSFYQERSLLLAGLSDIEKNYYSIRESINGIEEKLTTSRRNKEQLDL